MGPSGAHGDGPGEEWLTISAAARRLGVSRRAVQKRIERGTLHWRPEGNRGRSVLVGPATVAASGRGMAQGEAHSASGVTVPATEGLLVPVAVVVELRQALSAERERVDALTRELDGSKADLNWAQGESATLREVLAREQDRADNERRRAERLDQQLEELRAELAEARRPLLLRLIVALGWGRSR
jgi:hypothetical protein